MHHDSLLTLPCACTMLRKASRAVSRLYDEALAPYGMTIAQFALLRNIARRGGPELSRLAEAMVMERTTLYRALAPLEKAGWLRFEAARGKAKCVALTADGKAAMAAAEPVWVAVQERMIGRLGGLAELERQMHHVLAATQELAHAG